MYKTEKTDENHIFTTFDSFSVMVLVTFCLVIIISIVSHAMIDQRQSRAQKRTKQLAAQILIGGYNAVIYNETNNENNVVRDLASFQKLDIRPVGRIGMDPWGAAYYYKVFKDVNDHIQILVLSSGPDRKLNTREDDVVAESIGDASGLKIMGDDIATIQSGL